MDSGIKSEFIIQLNYRSALSNASSLEETASDLKMLADRDLEQIMGELSGAWTGSNARLFLRKAEQLQRDIKNQARQLENTASAIRQIATSIYNAEQEARRIALERQF